MNSIYEERLFSRWITLVLGAVTLALLVPLLGQLQTGSSGEVPVWFFPFIFLVFLLLTVNFAWLSIRVTDVDVVVAYGIIHHRVLWAEIVDCYVDRAPAAWTGGYGIRVGLYKGKRRLIYNTIGDPRVVLLTTNRALPEFVFSTAQPEELVSRVTAHLRTLKR